MLINYSRTGHLWVDIPQGEPLRNGCVLFTRWVLQNRVPFQSLNRPVSGEYEILRPYLRISGADPGLFFIKKKKVGAPYCYKCKTNHYTNGGRQFYI